MASYLHFSSAHPRSIFKGIIIGEGIRYVRTNTTEKDFETQIKLFTTRLHRRGYPTNFINRHIKEVRFKDRLNYIKNNSFLQQKEIFRRPIFKCIQIPRFNLLKQLVLKDLKNIQQYVQLPLFILLKNNSLHNILVRARHSHTDTESYSKCFNSDKKTISPTSPRYTQIIKPKKCKRSRCCTCQHFIEKDFFTSSTTKQRFYIRKPFNCSTKNIIYLITCTKCKKQYVGKTTKTLRERVNHHRTSIFTKQKRYLSLHFNLPLHSVANLSVQIIDSTNSTSELDSLESFWIYKLQTKEPKGLNCKI